MSVQSYCIRELSFLLQTELAFDTNTVVTNTHTVVVDTQAVVAGTHIMFTSIPNMLIGQEDTSG